MSVAHICPACRRGTTTRDAPEACPHCGFVASSFHPAARSRSAALALAAAVMLVPAYTLPVMAMERFGSGHADTIFSGVWKLWHQGMWGIAAIVFTASLVVPMLKLTALAVLLVAGRRAAAPALHRVHQFVHMVGRWSMLDVFLIAFLCGIVRFGSLATVTVRPGALAFAGAVVLTMLATSAYDPRVRAQPVHAPSAHE